MAVVLGDTAMLVRHAFQAVATVALAAATGVTSAEDISRRLITSGTTQAKTTAPAPDRDTKADPAAALGDALTAAPAAAQPAPAAKKAPPKKPVLVPGTGAVVKGGGDDFEDANFQWYYNHPKSSEEMDKRLRAPTARSRDGLWFEGPKRGTPDVVKRVELPAPGLDGSTHGLMFATLQSGIPKRVTGQMQQDDLCFNLMRVTGNGMSVANSPSVVVRVYLPPFEQWENRSGPTFGFRSGCYTHAIITTDDHPREGKWGLEEYWPGMFICFESSHEKRFKQDGAYLRIRGGRNGGEIMGPRITELGWWTLGLSFSPDGMVHYFASPGVDALTMDDHITSQFPYGYRTELVKTYFFNVCSRDDGRSWSTPWVIDDPKVYMVKRPQMATQPTRKR
jgi:hypothetical protein